MQGQGVSSHLGRVAVQTKLGKARLHVLHAGVEPFPRVIVIWFKLMCILQEVPEASFLKQTHQTCIEVKGGGGSEQIVI